MRRTLGHTLSLRHFSTGRGRGFSPVIGKLAGDVDDDVTIQKPGLGHGRGTTISPPPLSSAGRGCPKTLNFFNNDPKDAKSVENGQKSEVSAKNGEKTASFGENGPKTGPVGENGQKTGLFGQNDSISAAFGGKDEISAKKAVSFVENGPKPVSGGVAPKNEDPGTKKTVPENLSVNKDIHLGIVSALSGMGRGRGKTVNQSGPFDQNIENSKNLGLQIGASIGRGKVADESGHSDQKIGESRVVESNRHIRAKNVVSDNKNKNFRDSRDRDEDKRDSVIKDKGPKLSREDAVKKALGILSVGDGVGMGEGVGDDTGDRRMDRGERGTRGGFQGRGGGGRGRRGGRGIRFDSGRRNVRPNDRRPRDNDDRAGSGLYEGDSADGEKLAKTLGPEKMDMLAEAFEEASGRALPDPVEDTYIDALHTNMLIECEPEYLMEEFGTNPDIDDTPPIPLRDALEKMKPFLMAYENIQSHEEWEKIMEETMKNVPLMKEIVDHYSGPDRVTAKQQQKELRRVADTLPDRAHASVKRFTDRAILSLQSNPGWGFDKKCQFMDKLAWEVQQHYK